ncbi:PASTA domain-containing protein, partial [Blattabacterium cuenoti]|uniref:PASTA domain-containing protein n=1 Tax=Blattabacterium cuenoti TaxID=1653831 RepID=UPI00163C91AC
MNYSKYLFIIFFNLLIAILILYKITNLTLKWVDSYTKHGSYVIVPNLHSMTLKESIYILNKLGLKYDIDTSHYDPSLEPNQVLSFFPESGNHVKIGRYIYIQANSEKNHTTVLPNIVNKNKHIAIRLVQENHLFVKEIKYVNDLSKDIVLRVLYKGKFISSGYILPYQDNITLVIGKGNEFFVPNVIGMSLPEAIFILRNKLFHIINFYYDNPSDATSKNAKIYRQKPFPGKIKDRNQSVYLWLTTDKSMKKELFDNLIIKPTEEKQNKGIIKPTEEKQNKGIINPTEEKQNKGIIKPTEEKQNKGIPKRTEEKQN